jgi:hypothetical protein
MEEMGADCFKLPDSWRSEEEVRISRQPAFSSKPLEGPAGMALGNGPVLNRFGLERMPAWQAFEYLKSTHNITPGEILEANVKDIARNAEGIAKDITRHHSYRLSDFPLAAKSGCARRNNTLVGTAEGRMVHVEAAARCRLADIVRRMIYGTFARGHRR